jgi:hypothetical protein
MTSVIALAEKQFAATLARRIVDRNAASRKLLERNTQRLPTH